MALITEVEVVLLSLEQDSRRKTGVGVPRECFYSEFLLARGSYKTTRFLDLFSNLQLLGKLRKLPT